MSKRANILSRALPCAILAMVFFVCMCTFSVGSFAADDKPGLGTLKLDSYDPADNNTHVPVENAAWKLHFSDDVNNEIVRDINEKAFKVTDKKGKEIPYKAFFSPKADEKGYILVSICKQDDDGNWVSQTLEANAEYKLTILGSLASAGGATLGEDMVLSFTTVDQSNSTMVYMIMLGVMVVLMIVMTRLQKIRKQKVEAEAKAMKAINPYKLAKEKGISVAEAQAIVDKQKKQFEKRMKKAGIDPKAEAKKEAEEKKKKGIYRVSGPKPIYLGGSTYKTGRSKMASSRRTTGTPPKPSGGGAGGQGAGQRKGQSRGQAKKKRR